MHLIKQAKQSSAAMLDPHYALFPQNTPDDLCKTLSCTASYVFSFAYTCQTATDYPKVILTDDIHTCTVLSSV